MRSNRFTLIIAAAALASTVMAAPAGAEVVDFTVTGHVITTQAEIDFPGVWGVDENGNSLIGDSYVGTIRYVADPASDTGDSNYSQNLETPGATTGQLVVNGKTYEVSSGAGFQAYQKFTDYLNVTDSVDPNDNIGLFWQLFYPNGPNVQLNEPLSYDASNDSSMASSSGNAVIVAAGGGVLRASFDVDSFSVSPGVPEPASWALMVLGVGAAGALVRRERSTIGVVAGPTPKPA